MAAMMKECFLIAGAIRTKERPLWQFGWTMEGARTARLWVLKMLHHPQAGNPSTRDALRAL
jgi:hypothetical protein